jgi:hypothetical protein
LTTASIAKEKKKSEQAQSDKAYDQNRSPATLRTFIKVSYLIGHGDFLQFRLFDAGLHSPGDAAPGGAHDSTRVFLAGPTVVGFSGSILTRLVAAGCTWDALTIATFRCRARAFAGVAKCL